MATGAPHGFHGLGQRRLCLAPSTGKVYRLWGSDGGGIFGLLQADMVEDKRPYEIFDTFCGTSIGAAVATYLAMGQDPAALPAIMRAAFPDIFDKPFWWRMKPYGPLHPDTGLVKFCKQYFDCKLSEVKKPVYISSFNYSLQEPAIFSSTNPEDKDMPAYEAVLRSVSAPRYFPPRGDYVDGGLWANNPIGFGSACFLRDANIPYEDLDALSIGTGERTGNPIDMSNAANWTLLQWGTTIIDALLDGGIVKGQALIASMNRYRRYERFNEFRLESGWGLDDPSLIQAVDFEANLRKPSFDTMYKGFIS